MQSFIKTVFPLHSRFSHLLLTFILPFESSDIENTYIEFNLSSIQCKPVNNFTICSINFILLLWLHSYVDGYEMLRNMYVCCLLYTNSW